MLNANSRGINISKGSKYIRNFCSGVHFSSDRASLILSTLITPSEEMVERKLREKWSVKCQIISLFIYLVSYEVVWWSCSSLLFYNKFSWFLLNRCLRHGELYNYHDQYSVLNSIGIHLWHGRVHWPVSFRGCVLYSYIARSYCMLIQWLHGIWTALKGSSSRFTLC